MSCSDSERTINPETKVLDFVKRQIKFALFKIILLSVKTKIWVYSKIYIANLSVAGETCEKLPAQDTLFAK